MKKREIIAFVIAVIIIIVGFISCRKAIKYLSTVETAENIKNTEMLPDWLYYLPASAKNISYWMLPCFCTTYEYEVSEKDFLEWAKQNDIPLTEINGVSEIFRYSHHTTPYPDSNDPNVLEDYEKKRMAIVKKGYEYHRMQDNGGGSHIVYDSENQKAYHDFPHR